MEINRNENLSTICEKLEQLQSKVNALEEKVAELQDKAGTGPGITISEPIDIMFDEVSFVVPSRTQEFGVKSETPKPKPDTGAATPAAPAARKPETYSWQTAKAASPLSNILSGIALKDRGIFINTLFKEDARLFMDTINAFNAMGSLSEALDYIEAHFPEWNLASDTVYRLMMAVRRRLN